jgi:hypothetical protein
MDGSLEYPFVYGQSGARATPSYGKSDRSAQGSKRKGARACVVGAPDARVRATHGSIDVYHPTRPAYSSLASSFVYESMEPLGEGQGIAPPSPAVQSMPAPPGTGAPTLEQEFVYDSAAANAQPLSGEIGNANGDGYYGNVVPAGPATTLEQAFVYGSAAANAVPIDRTSY